MLTVEFGCYGIESEEKVQENTYSKSDQIWLQSRKNSAE